MSIAFAALYEGMPGEKVSGGRKAAPMIPRFFNPLAEEIKEILTPPSRALVIVEEENTPTEGILEALPATPLETGRDGEGVPVRAIPVDEDELDALPAQPVEESEEDWEERPQDPEPPRALPVEEDPPAGE